MAPEEADLQNPNYQTAYIGDIAGSAMMPNSDWHHVLHMPHRYSGAGYSALMALSFGLQPRLSIRGAYSGEWGDWINIATATPPQVYDLPLAAGIEATDHCKYRITQDGYVSIQFSIRRADRADLQGIIAPFSLPEGFRPARPETRDISLVNSSGDTAGFGHLHIYADGSTTLQGFTVAAKSTFCACGFWTA